MKIAVFVGSLQKNSYNKKLAVTLEGMLPEDVEFAYADIQVPLFNQDQESSFPPEAQALKDLVESSDGVLFVTPEYNRSVPGVLKNAIDWVSRPYGNNSFAGKPAGVVGASIGAVGTAVAQSDLRHIMAYLDMKILGQPEVYIANATTLPFSEAGELEDERWRENLQAYVDTFVAWVRTSSSQ